MFFAHSLEDKLDKSHWQTLQDHLCKVGELAGERGAKFGAARAATLAGQLHDLGKYSFAFQRRLEGGPRVDHATAGAKELLQLRPRTGADCIISQVVAHAIAGHHTGLPDSLGDDSSLDVRLKKEIEPLDPIWHKEIKPVADGLTPLSFLWAEDRLSYQFAFLGRMLFSDLEDLKARN